MEPSRSNDARWVLASRALVLGYAIVCGLLFRDYGITYDEDWASRHGQNLVAWYASGFVDRSFEGLSNLRYYGGLFEIPAAWIGPFTGMDRFEFRHLLNALFAVAVVAGIARIGYRVAGARAAFFGVLMLLTTPRFFGHCFNNPKDIPFAAGTVWALDALLAWLSALPDPPRRSTLWLGIAIGLALSVRMNAVLVLFYLFIGTAWWWWSTPARDRPARLLSRLSVRVLGVCGVAWLTMLPFWPYFQVSPILHPLAALVRLSHGTFIELKVLFDGQMMAAGDQPASYVWTWLTMVQPETYALGLLLAGIAALRSWRRVPPGDRRRMLWVVVATATLLSPVLAAITRPNLYDGIRHFLYCSVLLAVPAGAGLAWATAAARPAALRIAALAVFAALELVTVADMVRLHPYQTSYFNRSVAGGLAGVEGRFDTDYWGNSFQEGVRWLVDHADTHARPARVASNAFPTQTRHHLPEDRFEYIGSVDHRSRVARRPFSNPPDYYVATTRWSRHELYPGEIVYRVERDGVTLLVVVEVDREAALALDPDRGKS